MISKVIVSNQGALSALYGLGASQVAAALSALIASDQKRGIATQLVYLDDKNRMQALNAPPVANAGDDTQNKAAIDGVHEALKPDYLAILGGLDIVPMQRLDNTMPGDGDPDVPSDLPYACSGGYSRAISDFLNPTRVIGRIPGITGNDSPSSLVAAINTAAGLQPRNRDAYAAPYLAFSAAVWQGSSTQTAGNIFGNASALRLSPPDGPNWTNAQLGALSHFVNCHGGDNDPQWYGQQGNNYPAAMQSIQIAGKTPPGAIVAAECCYGGQLYPAPTGRTPGICNAYMANQAAAFCGSSTIAYGPTSGQGQADLMTQYFLINMLAGTSAGRGMLQARQKFIRNVVPLSPSDLKTMGQFNLMADPASQPVALPPAVATKAMPGVNALDVFAADVGDRRRRLLLEGNAVGRSAAWLAPDPQSKAAPTADGRLAALAREAGLKEWSHVMHHETGGADYLQGLALMKGPRDVFHVLHGRLPVDAPFPRFAVLIAREKSGMLITVQTQYSKS